MKTLPFIVALGLALVAPARAVQTNGSYLTTAPTGSDIANWAGGWGAPTLSGWDYVGQVNGASGVYLGNGWVLTAAHVGAGSFSLGGTTYSLVAGSARSISYNATADTDLRLFQIEAPPALPTLTLRTTAPSVASFSVTGDTVAMIGFGGGQGKTWGANTVTLNNFDITVSGATSTSFGTVYGNETYTGPGFQTRTVTNASTLVGGDSGGAAFIYNSGAARWELAGIHDAVGTLNSKNYSFMVQLDRYASQITAITAVPEGGAAWLLGPLLALGAMIRRRRLAAPLRGSTFVRAPSNNSRLFRYDSRI